MESVWDWSVTRVTGFVAKVESWRQRAQEWLDAAADRPLRAWVKPAVLALTATVGLVGLLHLLLAALIAAGVVSRWIGAVVVGVLALVSLGIVLRNVIISLADPGQRRLFLLALLASAAAILLGIEAFAAASIAASGHAVPLWTVERFYLRQLVGAVPLLDIPNRLEWTEPPIMPGLGGRLFVLGFTLIVIPPLVRVGIALYGYVERRAGQRRYTAAVADRLRRSGFGFDEPVVPVLLVAAAGVGAAWSVVNPRAHTSMRVWSMTSLAFVFTVAAMLLAAAVVAGVCVFWLTEQSWVFTLGPAIGLVWFDSPVRQALLPSAAALGLWGRIGVTLAVWLLLLYIVLIFLWSEPEFAEAAVALALVVGFIGADAPASRWLRGHLTWRLWGFPVEGPVIAACGWFTVAFLLQLLWRAPRRPPILGRRDLRDTASGLRQDLRGYVLVGVHVVIAAGAALALLRATGAVRVSTARDDRRTQATQALTAAARYVAGSLPGPDVPKILDWRLATDFAGPWAGLVIVLAVAAVVLFVLFPLTRTVLLWARLAAGRPRPGQALAEIPAVVAANLAVVVDFLRATANPPAQNEISVRRVWLFTQQVKTSSRVVAAAAAEHRLVQAALDMPRLLDLFGEGSILYRTADRALSSTTEAYRAYHKAFGPASSRFTQIEPKIAAARAAVDEFTDTVERWQTSWHDTPAQGTPNGPPTAT